MRKLMLTAALIALASPAFAADCTLTLHGKTHISGPCRFEQFEKSGSFTVAKGDWFAYVYVNGKSATGNWNDDDGHPSRHADADLGDLTRHGACWSNSNATVCAR